MNNITGQTIEVSHLHNVYLNETLVPYATLNPLQALLPVKQGDAIPTEENGVGGIRMGGLEWRMRERWQTVSDLWERNKAEANRLNLLGNLNYLNKLSSQFEWQQSRDARPIRLVQSEAGQPTAAVLADDDALIDETLYWITCKNTGEANYLLAIINSIGLYDAVSGLMSKGQFGARHLHKHLWKLPIPEYDPAVALHAELAGAGEAAARGAADRLAGLRAEYRQRRDDWDARGRRGREPALTVTIARRELRHWLRATPEGAAAEAAVSRLLAGG